MTVPIFQYHAVEYDPPGWIAPLTVTPAAFAEQLHRLADSGMQVVPLRRLVSAIRGGAPLPARAAVLTFDDGYADFYWTVAPLLAELELPATLFVTTGAIHAQGGRASGSRLPEARMLSWNQIAGLDAYGVEIGGHSFTHAELDILPARRLGDEIGLCKDQLEQAVGHSVAAFAYPHGYSSASVRRQVRSSGWAYACGIGNALSSDSDDPLRLARLTVRADTPAAQFSAWARGTGAPTAPSRGPLATEAWRVFRRMRGGLRPGPVRR